MQKFDFLNEANIGKDYNGFVLVSIDDLPDYKTKAVYLRHKTTGLEVYHILKDDKENLYAFAFRTVEKNSKEWLTLWSILFFVDPKNFR